MHHKEQFKKLVEQWLELGLPKTCTSLDLYASIRIERKGKAVIFTNVKVGKEGEMGKVYLDENDNVTEMVYISSTPYLGLILFGLEQAIEKN